MSRISLLLGAAAIALAPAFASAQDKPGGPTDAPNDAPAADDGQSAPRGDIIITASAIPSDTATIAAKVDAKTIREKGGASIADSLSDVPGIAATGFAAGASRPIIRGMDANRVRVLENGLSSADVSEIGPDHGVPIDPLSARSIEVVRGPATLRYGSQAIGGVVNVLNNRVPTILPGKIFDGEATASFDTVANTKQGSLLTDIKLGDFVLHADGYVRRADDYDTPLGTLTNSFFRGDGESIGGSYFFDGGKSHIGAAVIRYDAQYGIPGEDTYIDMHQTKVLGKSSFDLGGGTLKTLTVDGGYADYRHDERDPDGVSQQTFINREWNGRAELLFGELGPFTHTAVGVEVINRRFSAQGEALNYLAPTKTQTEAAFLFTEIPFGPAFRLQASGRVEASDISGTPVSGTFTKRNFTPLGGAISALFDANSAIRLGLSFSSTARAPAVTELFARGGHDGPATYETGDSTLRMERANSLEATVRIKSGPFKLEASVYSTWFSNYIYGDLTGRTCDEDGNCAVGNGEALKELFYRQQGAHFRGFEGEVSYQVVKTTDGGLTARVLTDYVRATLDDGSNVPRIPPFRAGGGLSWASNVFDAGFLVMHVGAQDKFGSFDSATPGYVAVSAQASWRPFKDNPGIEFAIVAKNLTNDVQRDAAAFNRDVVVQPGRNIRFVVRLATF